MEAPKAQPVEDNKMPTVEEVNNENTQSPQLEEVPSDPKAELLSALTPPPLPDAIVRANQADLDKAEKMLAQFGYTFPIKGLLESYKALHQTQVTTAKILVEVASQTGRANQFIGAIEQQQVKMQEEYNKKLEAMKTLGIQPEQMQQPQAAPRQGMDLSMLGQFLPQIMQAFTQQPAQPANTMGINFAEIGQKFVNAKLEEALNPAPDPLAEVGKLLLTQAASKVAASAALK